MVVKRKTKSRSPPPPRQVQASALSDDETCGSLALAQEEASGSDSSISELAGNVFVCGVPTDDPDGCFSPSEAMVDFCEGTVRLDLGKERKGKGL